MRHVDEGTLHAYLDGQAGGRAGGPADRRSAGQAAGAPDSGSSPTSEVSGVERHLAGCAECRARLDEVRLVRDRAAELLRQGVPGAVGEMAPFADVLARAKAPKPEPRDRRPGFRLTSPLAWAATVVLAFGVGWYAGGRAGWRPGGPEGSTEPQTETPMVAVEAPQPDMTPPAARRIASGGPSADRSSAQPAGDQRERDRTNLAAAEAERRTDQPAVPAPALIASQGAGEAKAAATPPAAPTPASQKAEGAKVVARSAAEAPQLADRLALRKETADAAPSAVGLASNQLTAQSTDESRWREVDRATAQATLGGAIVTVPDAGPPIFYVSLETGNNVVRTIQSLGAGRALELRQERLAPSSSPGMAGSRNAAARAAQSPERPNHRPTASPSATIEVNGYRITATGPLAADSLRAVLERAVGRAVRR